MSTGNLSYLDFLVVLMVIDPDAPLAWSTQEWIYFLEYRKLTRSELIMYSRLSNYKNAKKLMKTTLYKALNEKEN